MLNRENQLSVYITSLNCNIKEKMHSDRLVSYFSSKDFAAPGTSKWSRSKKYSIAYVDVNQLLIQNGKEDGIRKHLLEFYGLKQVDGKIPLPQVVLSEFKTVKKAPVNAANSQAHSETAASQFEESKCYTKKGDSNRKGK